jgi:hypothetical protein
LIFDLIFDKNIDLLSYAGENCFKQLKPNVYGPTHIRRQIAINASVQNNINQYLNQDESRNFCESFLQILNYFLNEYFE